jgi:LmbE family N-acetylglucosaminyl deacetylase
MRLAVVSPHLDDAVFACGNLLAACRGSTVCTVFTGGPPPGAPLTPWDRGCGFADGDDVMAIRRDEDRRALATLDAEPHWLGFRDAQYGPSPSPDRVAAALASCPAIAAADLVCVPLGLFHADHVLVHGVARHLRGRRPLLAYEDALYRRIDDLLAERLAELAATGFAPSRCAGGVPAGVRKRRAISCYASQLRGLRRVDARIDDLLAPEGFWWLRR